MMVLTRNVPSVHIIVVAARTALSVLSATRRISDRWWALSVCVIGDTMRALHRVRYVVSVTTLARLVSLLGPALLVMYQRGGR